MFHSARLKLTAWYLLIVIIITSLFSGGIYLNVSKELERGFWRAQRQTGADILAEKFGIRVEDLPHGIFEENRPISPEFNRFFLLNDDFIAAKKRLVLALLIVNGEIWILSAIAGYFLAGKTLRPIARVMEEQQRFISDASHELRTPITALKTTLEVSLGDKKISQYSKQIMEENLEDVNNLETLTDNLLGLMTPTELNGPKISEVKVNDVLRRVAKNFAPLIKKNKQKFTISIQPKSLRMITDKNSLSELISIFLDNAVKYTNSGGEIILTAKKQKKKILIEVQDSGIGISEEDLLHVFDRFYRADNARTKNGSTGYGLGLSMAKKITDQLKGKIEVKSDVGRGTIFTVILPQKYS